ncbi:hypothetical protein BCV72DRAFT_219992 [Rhizopus microsporus var. microsporus]|uniref:WW domain-containing protein n=1 Tax=Rhizopus microsporus var. microsporus TaxID=86635 RepID=A0A1X0RHB0_RHIZD|nr:hypothetical protein BCV72DRAFT_219992 [Rhizopus microsporus var. microsporus]
MNQSAYYNPNFYTPVLPAGWVEYKAPTGQPYWYNTLTRQSTWTFPVQAVSPQSQQQEQPKEKKKKQIKKKIPGTHWLFVLTHDGYEFYYDRETKTSVWEMPKELEEPMKELERLEKEEKEQKEEESKKRKLEQEQKEEEETKKIKMEQEEKEEEEVNEEKKEEGKAEPTEMTEEDIMWQLEQMEEEPEEQTEEQPEEQPKEIKQEKVNEISEEERIRQFYELLKERNISPFAVYSTEYPKLMSDPRFELVPNNKQKTLFNKYCHELGEKLKNEQRNKKKPEEEFRELLESKVTEKMYFDDFRRKCKDDPRFKVIPSTREREALFKDYVKHHLSKKKKDPVGGYMMLLRETKEIRPGIRWRDAKKILEKDERYHAIESKPYI